MLKFVGKNFTKDAKINELLEPYSSSNKIEDKLKGLNDKINNSC